MFTTKYSTTTPTGSLRKGNAVINITQDNDGPTSTTGFYNGIEVPEGGYLVILTKSGSSPAYFPCVGDTQLINLARNRFDQTAISQIRDAIEYFSNRTDVFIITSVPNEVVTGEFDLYFNGKILSSYPATGQSVFDLSGNSKDGFFESGTGFNPTTNAFTFDGADDRIRLNEVYILEEMIGFTCFFKMTDSGGFHTFLGNVTSPSSGNDEKIGLLDGNFFFRAVDNGGAANWDIGYTSANDLKWNFVAFSRTNTNTLLASLNGGPWVGGGVLAGPFEFDNIGMNGDGQPFIGEISEVNVYRKSLTPTEVKQNYFGGKIVTDGLVFNVDASNLVSYENGSTTAYSLTGSDPGTLLNGTEFGVNNGGVFNFDGVNDYILQDTNNTDCNPGLINDFTVEGWSRPTFPTSSTLYGVAGKMDTVRNGWMIGWNNGKAYATFRNASGSYSDATIDLTANDVVANNEWHHIVATLDRDVGAKLYVNGELKSTVNSLKTDNHDLNSTSRLAIGRFSQNGAYQMDGDIGNVKVYNRLLTSEEIKQNFEAQKSKFGF